MTNIDLTSLVLNWIASYGAPMVAGLLSAQPFWFHLAIDNGTETVQVPLPAELDRAVGDVLALAFATVAADARGAVPMTKP